jgi:hypothetical protein
MLPCAICQQSSPPAPLTESEKRAILGQLYELQACRNQVAAYSDFVSRDAAQDAREKASFERALELERQATALKQKEVDLANEKASLYESLYRSVTKRPGWWCRFRRIFGARCS